MDTRVRHGITLFRRKCKYCSLGVFWVPKSSPQVFCSRTCLNMSAGTWDAYTGKGISPKKLKKQKRPKQEEIEDAEFD